MRRDEQHSEPPGQLKETPVAHRGIATAPLPGALEQTQPIVAAHEGVSPERIQEKEDREFRAAQAEGWRSAGSVIAAAMRNYKPEK